jgi:hypothetical protein
VVSFTLQLLYSQEGRMIARAGLHVVAYTGNGISTSEHQNITHIGSPRHARRLKESGSTFPYIPFHVQKNTYRRMEMKR